VKFRRKGIKINAIKTMLINPASSYSPGRDYGWINTLVSSTVTDWLEPKTKDLILDYLVIREGYKSWAITGLSDYSYLITPAFKALEGTLIQIAKNLGFKLEDYGYKIGVVFNEENLEKFYNDTLDKLDSLTEENKLDIQQWLNNARRLLRHLRHSPAHYSGEVKESYNKAFFVGDQILFTINEMCLSLLNNNILKPEKHIKPTITRGEPTRWTKIPKSRANQ
jgi:hypothetical protein